MIAITSNVHPADLASQPRHESGAKLLDASEQRGVALQSTPEIDRPDEIDQFALGVRAARVVLDRPRRERR